MCLAAFNSATQKKISFFTVGKMCHCNRYSVIFVKSNSIGSNAFFICYAWFLISKCLFKHKKLPLFKAPPHNSRLGAQAACRAKIFRDIFQKCSPIRQGLPALFGSSHKKFFGTLHHLELCGVAIENDSAHRNAISLSFSAPFRQSGKVGIEEDGSRFLPTAQRQFVAAAGICR